MCKMRKKNGFGGVREAFLSNVFNTSRKLLKIDVRKPTAIAIFVLFQQVSKQIFNVESFTKI